MSFSTLPLSYCGNVHPAATVQELLQTLQQKTAQVQTLTGRRIAAGLWIPDGMAQELIASPAHLQELRNCLQDLGLVCYTLNAFPYGNFHSERVKEQVYLPDWTAPERLEYTLRCAKILAELLPEGVEGSISTVPLGFKALPGQPDFSQRCQNQLIEAARQLDELHDETGRIIRLAIEPEPLCVLETTAETQQFFQQLRETALHCEMQDLVQMHIGVCYDVCHQAVEFEDIAASIQSLQQAEIRINKVHITCAVELKSPAKNSSGRTSLARFAEPRYLHQTFCQTEQGTGSQTDLTADFVQNPPADWLAADRWRIHFHVPVNAETFENLGTTRSELQMALQAVKQLEYAPHLEVETYTWAVLPGQSQPDVCAGLAAELNSTYDLLEACQ